MSASKRYVVLGNHDGFEDSDYVVAVFSSAVEAERYCKAARDWTNRLREFFRDLEHESEDGYVDRHDYYVNSPFDDCINSSEIFACYGWVEVDVDPIVTKTTWRKPRRKPERRKK